MSSADSSTVSPPPTRQPTCPESRGDGADTRVLKDYENLPVIYHPPSGFKSELPRIRGYEILSLIGTGGMGVVYKARQRDLQRVVAIKMLHDATLADAEFRSRFRAEAEAVARLQHPNIIQVFEIGTVVPKPGDVHPSPFISLEFIEGGSLERLTTAPQSPVFSAKLVEKLARAAHAAHCLDVVHRDLKPANVLLTADGEPKLADFGIAKQIGPGSETRLPCLTQTGMAVGTPEYMAPEQVAGEAPTPAVDTYALGVILYQLLTARIPFQGATPSDTMYLVRHQEPVSPRRLQPRLPRDLDTICLKCLSKQPGRRYESAEALADDLARWLDNRPIHARPVGTLERTLRWMKRNPTVVSLWAAVIICALLGVTGVYLKWKDAEFQAAVARGAAYQALERTQAERWERYRADITIASSALQLHHADSARRALDAAPEEHRNWEWRFFSQQIDTSEKTLRGEAAKVHWLLVTPDAGTIVSVTDTDVTRFWDVAGRRDLGAIPDSSAMGRSWLSPRGDTLVYLPAAKVYDTAVLHDVAAFKTRAVLRGHTGRIGSMSYSHDGTRLATNGDEGEVRIWDAATGKLVRLIKAHETASGHSAFSLDGATIATVAAKDPTARVWDLATGRLILEMPGHGSNADVATFNRTGDRLLITSSYPANKLFLHEYPSGKLMAEMSGHTNQILQAAFSPDGSRIATASRDQTIRLWEGRTGKLIAHLRGHNNVVNHLAFSPDSTRLVSGSADQTLRLWDTDLGASLAVMHGHQGDVFGVAYTPDGKTIVSGSRDNTVKLWDAHKAEFGNTLRGHTSFIYSVAFHPDGRRVASSGWDGTVRVWDATSRRQQAIMSLEKDEKGKDAIVSSIAFHPEGKLLASLSRDDTVRLWDVDTGREVHRWHAPTSSWQDSRLAFSPKGDLLAAGDRDRGVRLWDVKTRVEAGRLAGLRHVCRDVAFSPDGRWLATADEAAEVRIWDVEKRLCKHVLQGHAESAYAVAFNRDGTLLASGSLDGTVRLWDTKTWTEVGKLTTGRYVYSVAFTPAGDRLACGCADNTIRLWDVATRQEVADLRGHAAYVHAIAFSPDGTRLVSGSGDFTVRVWDTLATR